MKPQHKTSGFTLVEVLIGLMVLSLLLSLLSSAFFSFIKQSDVISKSNSDLSEQLAPRQFLKNVIGNQSPLAVRYTDGGLSYLFEGSPQALKFTGQLPAHRGGGGLHFLSLSLGTMPDDTSDLVLHDTSAHDVNVFNEPVDTNTWRETVLQHDVETLTFSYFGQKDNLSDAQWHEDWESQAMLPILIQLRITTNKSISLPPLVIQITSRHAASQPYLVWSE